MGQKDVIDLLKNNQNKWMDSKEIAEKMNVGVSCTVVKLRKLRSQKMIQYMKRGNRYFYRFLNLKNDS